MVPFGSWVCMLGHQGMALFGRDWEIRVIGVVVVMVSLHLSRTPNEMVSQHLLAPDAS